MWGDYGRMERKEFMGVAQIHLNDLDLTAIVVGWYKLFANCSLDGGGGGAMSTSSSLTQMTSASPVHSSSAKEKLKNQNSESSVESAYQSGSAETKS